MNILKLDEGRLKDFDEVDRASLKEAFEGFPKAPYFDDAPNAQKPMIARVEEDSVLVLWRPSPDRDWSVLLMTEYDGLDATILATHPNKRDAQMLGNAWIAGFEFARATNTNPHS